MTLSNTILQYYVKDEYVGRVMALYQMQFGLTSFSSFAAGMLTEVTGVQWAVGGFAIVLVLLCLVSFAVIPRVRRLD